VDIGCEDFRTIEGSYRPGVPLHLCSLNQTAASIISHISVVTTFDLKLVSRGQGEERTKTSRFFHWGGMGRCGSGGFQNPSIRIRIEWHDTSSQCVDTITNGCRGQSARYGGAASRGPEKAGSRDTGYMLPLRAPFYCVVASEYRQSRVSARVYPT